MVTIYSLQEVVREKELGIKILSQQIAAKQREQISTDLVNMKMNVIQLQNKVDQLHTMLKLAQEEVRWYQEHATSLLTATCRPPKVEVCSCIMHVHQGWQYLWLLQFSSYERYCCLMLSLELYFALYAWKCLYKEPAACSAYSLVISYRVGC